MANKINDQISVSPQILPTDIENIAQVGFQIMICNRPDGEEIGQPLTADIRAAAEKSGMKFLDIPIVSGQFTPKAIEEFSEVMSQGQKVFAYCRTGTRSCNLWALSQAGKMPKDQILSEAKNAGYDLSGIAGYLG